jgi:hypothetical protein
LVVEAILAIVPPTPNRPSHGCHPYDEQKHRAVRPPLDCVDPGQATPPRASRRGTAALSNVARRGRDRRRAWPGRAVSQARPTVSTKCGMAASRKLVSECARMRARPAGPADRPSSTISPGVGRRRRPIDGL